MTAVELDPLFLKALKLLNSRSKDSADQLKQLLDDVLAQRKLGDKKSDDDKEKKVPPVPTPISSVAHKRESIELAKKREIEKRNLEKLKTDSSDFLSMPKRPRVETSELTLHDSGSEKTRDEVKRVPLIASDSDEESEDDDDDEEDDDAPLTSKLTISSTSSMQEDAESIGFDMDEYVCVVCKQFRVRAGNQLVDCQECHKLYHQECHRPPVITKNINDPRFVWYCSRCSKNLKKMANKPAKVKPAIVSLSKDTQQPSKPSKPDTSFQQAFKRVEPAKSVSLLKDASSGSGTQKSFKGLSGMASLAANLSGKVVTSEMLRKSESTKASPGRSDSNSKGLRPDGKLSKSESSAPMKHSFLSALNDRPIIPKSSSSSSGKSAFSRLDVPGHSSSASFLKDSSRVRLSADSVKTSSSSSSAKMSQSSMASADKRLSKMKRNAEKKMNEKRSLLK